MADLYRAAGRDPEGEALLRRTLEHAPVDAALHHALGLILVRLRRLDEALEALRRACELAPGEPRYAYVYGVALFRTDSSSSGRRRRPTGMTLA